VREKDLDEYQKRQRFVINKLLYCKILIDENLELEKNKLY